MAECRGKQRACPPLCMLICLLAFLLRSARFCLKEAPPGCFLFLLYRRSKHRTGDTPIKKTKGDQIWKH